MILVTSQEITGKKIVNTLGLVHGSAVCSRPIGGCLLAALASPARPKLTRATELLPKLREKAIARMMAGAEGLGGQRRSWVPACHLQAGPGYCGGSGLWHGRCRQVGDQCVPRTTRASGLAGEDQCRARWSNLTATSCGPISVLKLASADDALRAMERERRRASPGVKGQAGDKIRGKSGNQRQR